MNIQISRRRLLQGGVSSAALASFGVFERALAATSVSSGYKALVCVFLNGGNNGFNWLVPTTSAGYQAYKTSRSNLALDSSQLLPLAGTASDGYAYGLHPSCPELQSLYGAGNLAFLGNVGPLIAPTTPAQARAGSVALPPQLFSHADQATAWMTSLSNSPERYGWGGRVADLFTTQLGTAKLAYNVTLAGSNYFQEGRRGSPYVLGYDGAPVLNETSNGGHLSGLRKQTTLDLLAQGAANPNVLVAARAGVLQSALSKTGLIDGALASAGDLSTTFPSFEGDTYLGQQLHAVARCIKAQAQVGDSRQIFYVQMNGFDTHNGELAGQTNLLKILSQNLSAFWTALGEIGVRNQVTLFTASDFGRSLGSNGDGSDHAWGNHHLMLGGAVAGGRYYGKMPSLVINGADDMGDGRIVPTTSTDQYAATLSRWFGVADSDLGTVFPNLGNFSQRNLGFLG